MSKAKQSGPYQLRIIGGAQRGRKVKLNHQTILRPTPDRVRETIFNWLMNDIQEANCLDLYAGSGILGFEALSRGANKVLAVENHPDVVSDISNNFRQLEIEQERYTLLSQDVLDVIKTISALTYDIVFLDPPYQMQVLETCLLMLVKNQWVHEDSLVYLESNKPIASLNLPDGWSVYRDKKAGVVHYGLIQR